MDILQEMQNKRVCVAVSGGVDSTALLHFLSVRRERYGFALSAVHCEHGIRGKESLADRAFVENICARWGIPLTVFSEDCPARAKRDKESLETAARSFRYESFAALIENDKADYIATAHHLDDEAETVLFRLARGTSLTGAQGMTEKNGWLIRPFLHWSRADILAYAQENGLAYQTDSTNMETDATRNKLRLEVFPILENAVAGAKENLVRFASIAAEDDALLYALAKELIFETDRGFCVRFDDKKPLFRRACLLAMKSLGVERDYTAAHLDSVFELQEKQGGARVSLPKGVIAQKTRAGIEFFPAAFAEETVSGTGETEFTKMRFDGGVYEVNVSSTPPKPLGNEWKTLRVDGDKIPQNAVFRFRKAQDEMEKFGGGTRTLKRFFNDKKIPVGIRGALPLIAEKDGNKVFAVCGVEIADGVKVTEDTQSVLYISIQKR